MTRRSGHAHHVPELGSQGRHSLQLITAAEAAGHARVAEMNKQVAANLDKIITALEADGDERRQPPMRPDPATPLTVAEARLHELTRARAIQAVCELDRAGTHVTFASVAAAALGISRSWLHTQPESATRSNGYAPAPAAPQVLQSPRASSQPTRDCSSG
jgi:hypothetical protein